MPSTLSHGAILSIVQKRTYLTTHDQITMRYLPNRRHEIVHVHLTKLSALWEGTGTISRATLLPNHQVYNLPELAGFGGASSKNMKNTSQCNFEAQKHSAPSNLPPHPRTRRLPVVASARCPDSEAESLTTGICSSLMVNLSGIRTFAGPRKTPFSINHPNSSAYLYCLFHAVP